MSFDSDFVSHSGIKWHGTVGTVEYGGGDRTLVVMFYMKPVHNPQKSNEQGRPFYEDKIYVRIHPPGERLNIADRPATEDDKRRFPMQWNQFKDNKLQTADGTPVELLYPDQPSIAAMLRASGVQTIEHCAGLSGTAIDSIGMGAQKYVNDAAKYLEASNKGVAASQLRHELEERDNQIRTLTKQIDMLKEQLAKINEANSAKVDISTLQALLAGAQGRPQFPPTGGPVAPQFDPQTAQINATHKTTDLAPKKAKRARQRLGTTTPKEG